MKILFAFAAVGLVLCLNGCASLVQHQVLPGSYLKPPNNIVAASPSYELLTLQTRDGTKIAAQLGLALDKGGHPLSAYSVRPTVIFLYGNLMCIADSQGILEDFRRMGVNVLIPEYPGYGMSEGSPSEQGCYAAADAAFEYLVHRIDIDHGLIVAAGMSLGSGPAVDLASREQVAGLILIVPFTRIRDGVHDFLAWYLRWAVPLLAPHVSFDNIAKLPRVSCPFLFVQAKRDQLTSAQRSDQLAAAATTKTVRILVDSDHNGSWQAGRKEVEVWLRTTFQYAESSASRREKPNQAPEPTPTTVTPPAGQEARQP